MLSDSDRGKKGVELAASARDRDRAFRKARRHTWLVRALRVLLPATAVVSLGAYVIGLASNAEIGGGRVSVGAVRVDPTNLTMDNPSYDGFARDGSQYRVRARSAVTDLRMSGPIKLLTIDGELIQPNGATTRLKAKWGTYDQKKDLLELYERIDVDGTDGLKARLTRATVHTKESRILSSEPVEAETATGTIRARSMEVLGKTRTAAFRDDVVVTLKPAAPSAAGSAPAESTKRSPLGGLQPASGEPVVVTSARLDVDDVAHSALFRESVVVRQGEAELTAPELDVLYEGRPVTPGKSTRQGPDGQGADGKPQDATGPAAAAGTGETAQARLRTILARGGVVMVSRGDRAESATLAYDAQSESITLDGDVVMTQAPDRRVTADTVLIDQRAETVLMTGSVAITQARNVMRAGRAAIDRKAGTARLSSPEAGKAGRISTLFYQAKADKPVAKATKATQAEPADAGGLGALGGGFKSDPNAPVEVEAATLDINDHKHTAVYTGSVVAKQGDFVVRTEELTAHYVGETGLASDGAAVPKEKAKSGAGPAELKRIEARRGVAVTGKDGQQATSEWANFDVKANTIVMGGTVETRHGKQVFRLPDGMRLVINLATGVTRTEVDPAGARTGPQVSGAFATSVASQANAKNGVAPACPKGAICRSGRLELILYPNQLEKSKAKAAPAPDAGVTTGSAARRKPRARQTEPAGEWGTSTEAPSR